MHVSHINVARVSVALFATLIIAPWTHVHAQPAACSSVTVPDFEADDMVTGSPALVEWQVAPNGENVMFRMSSIGSGEDLYVAMALQDPAGSGMGLAYFFVALWSDGAVTERQHTSASTVVTPAVSGSPVATDTLVCAGTGNEIVAYFTVPTGTNGVQNGMVHLNSTFDLLRAGGGPTFTYHTTNRNRQSTTISILCPDNFYLGAGCIPCLSDSDCETMNGHAGYAADLCLASNPPSAINDCTNMCTADEYFDLGTSTCTACTTDEMCATSSVHGGYAATACDPTGTEDSTCFNTCGAGTYFDTGLGSCELCATDSSCSQTFGHDGWRASGPALCDGSETIASSCSNQCGDGEYYDDVTSGCLSCPTDASCAADNGHAGWIASGSALCNGNESFPSVCMNLCTDGEYFDETAMQCTVCNTNATCAPNFIVPEANQCDGMGTSNPSCILEACGTLDVLDDGSIDTDPRVLLEWELAPDLTNVRFRYTTLGVGINTYSAFAIQAPSGTLMSDAYYFWTVYNDGVIAEGEWTSGVTGPPTPVATENFVGTDTVVCRVPGSEALVSEVTLPVGTDFTVGEVVLDTPFNILIATGGTTFCTMVEKLEHRTLLK